ncbi:MAG TPA: NADPH:quinone oxidoreductase family protein [Rubrobacter sp.]
MKAVQIERFVAPEVLEVAEVSSPEPQGDEVLIEVEAAGVNRADLLTRSGLYHSTGQPPLVPGFEGSGVVHEVGDSVERFSPGDRVFGFGGRPGFYAEQVAVSERRVVGVPEGLDFACAAALPTAPLSAWYCLGHPARLGAGEKILIYAAASGVGDAAVQIAELTGAEVLAVAGSEEKVAWALRNGADHGVNYAEHDVLSEIDVIFGEGGVDVVLDAVGGVRFAEALMAVGHGGGVVALANVALEPSTVDTRDFYPKNATIHGFQLTNLVERLGSDPRGDLEELARLAARGELKVHVDIIFPLAEAHRHLEGRRNRGKVILELERKHT